MREGPFSRRHGYIGTPPEITIREDAPEDLRYVVLAEALEAGLTPASLRTIASRVLRTRPDPGNWSEYPNIWDEVQRLIFDCPWFQVYDIIEGVLRDINEPRRQQYRDALNAFFIERGIGWRLEDAQVIARGEEAFELAIPAATDELARAGRLTARSEIEEALRDLSRRPEPDLTGAIHHSIGALECVARDVTNDPRSTLGEILRRNPGLLPRPLDAAVSQIWGYSSEYARHIREGQIPEREDAELVVGMAATIATYVSRKHRRP